MPKARRPSRALRWIRGVLVAGYAGFVLFGLVDPRQPRVFWTMLLPLLPLAIVLMGFPAWRRICPLAWFGEAGRALNRGTQRKVPAWMERWFFPLTFAGLLAMLVLRLVATNGDGAWLAGLLVVLALAAALTNRIWTGKTWCNFFCPVGFVERAYTEPNSLYTGGNSICAKCTACKRHCPDIDQENAYWKDLTEPGRRASIYAFPGLVLAFYVYYWLRRGDWEAYFDGRWTRIAVDADLVSGPGLFFAPSVPALAAATATLVLFSAASCAIFLGVERLVGLRVGDGERRRHLTLAIAAFAAFNLFYLFAGAPTLRRLPGGTRTAAFVAPLVGTLFLVRRWRRRPEHFIGERSAARLLRSWPFDEPPPSDPAEVYGWIQASRHAREKDLSAYTHTVREMIADGLVRPGELKLLDGVRKQLGISEQEHEQVVARLTEEERELFEEGAAGGIEERAQLESYQAALAEALLRGARESEIEELREGFGIDAAAHASVLERTRGASGELLTRARRQLERAERLHHHAAVVGATLPTAARVFLCFLLARARDEALSRLLEHLEVAGDAPIIQALRRRLFASDADRRRAALELLTLACPGADGIVERLEPLLARRPPAAAEPGPEGEPAALARLLSDPDPYLRAGAVWAAAELASDGPPEVAGGDELAVRLAAARKDRHALVRETAAGCLRGGRKEGAAAVLSPIEIMYFLHTAPFFSTLDPADLYDLSLFAIDATVEPPRAICEEGDADSDALFVVISGRAAVFRRPSAGEGEGRKVETLGRGQLVGDLSVLDGSPREATVRPEGGPVRVLRIPGQSLRSSLLRNPRVAESLIRSLAGRIRRLSQDASAKR